MHTPAIHSKLLTEKGWEGNSLAKLNAGVDLIPPQTIRRQINSTKSRMAEH